MPLTTVRSDTGLGRRFAPLFLALWLGVLGLASCGPSGDEVTTWRIRAHDTVDLNEAAGWAAADNAEASVQVDRPFRIRFEVNLREAGTARLRLEARRNEGPWMPLQATDHPQPEGIASPVTSIIASRAYDHGEEAEDLIGTVSEAFAGGSGISLRPSPLLAERPAGSTEWEWPLVIRFFSDGGARVEEGDVFEYRLVTWEGTPLGGDPARVTATVPDGHLGGTFVETPGRIGPFEASNGDLYFVQEPSETDNVFMIVKSGDRGRSWREVDGANRPVEADLEAVSAVLVEGTIHILHQADAVWYHAFRTSDHPEAPDTWAVQDEAVHGESDPPTQVTALAARSDGSLVAVYGADAKLAYRVRSPDGRAGSGSGGDGSWGGEAIVDAATPDTLSGPVVVVGANDEVHLAYVDLRGNGWIRRILPDGALTTREPFTGGLGTAEEDRAAILPLNRLPSGAISIVYRPEDGRLLERRLSAAGALGPPAVVTSVAVASGLVDSDQVTADAISVGDNLHVLFVEAATGSLWHVVREGAAPWGTPTLVLDGIEGQWVRGAFLERGPDGPIYGYVVDTGSWGGSGMNRYGEVPVGFFAR